MKWLLGGGWTSGVSKKPEPATYLDTDPTSIDGNTEDSPLLKTESAEQEGRKKELGIPLVGGGISTFWHEWQMCRIGRGLEPDMRMDWLWAGLIYEGVWQGMLGGGPVGWWRGSP